MTGGYYLGAIFNPDKDARIRAMNQEPTGIAGQAASFAASEASRVERENKAASDAQAAALKAQQDAASEAERQQKLLESQRQDAANLAQQRLQQSNFEQQQKINQAQFENQLALLNKQESMRQAQQALSFQPSSGFRVDNSRQQRAYEDSQRITNMYNTNNKIRNEYDRAFHELLQARGIAISRGDWDTANAIQAEEARMKYELQGGLFGYNTQTGEFMGRPNIPNYAGFRSYYMNTPNSSFSYGGPSVPGYGGGGYGGDGGGYYGGGGYGGGYGGGGYGGDGGGYYGGGGYGGDFGFTGGFDFGGGGGFDSGFGGGGFDMGVGDFAFTGGSDF